MVDIETIELVFSPSFTAWFERSFPRWVEYIAQCREAGLTRSDIERHLADICTVQGAHPLFVVGARSYMRLRWGDKTYIPPVRFS